MYIGNPVESAATAVWKIEEVKESEAAKSLY